jgi:hypothetical protein
MAENDHGEQRLQAFKGKSPAEQRQIYIQQVMQDAIKTGLEEGYPIRDRVGLEKQIAEQATPENIQAYKGGLREEAGIGKAEQDQGSNQQAVQKQPRDLNTQWLANTRPAWERGADTERSR